MKRKMTFMITLVCILLCGCTFVKKENTKEVMTKEEDIIEKDTTDEPIQEEVPIEEGEEQITNIDWTDFVKIQDIVYENAELAVPEEKIGEFIEETTANPPWEIKGTTYELQNGEAGWLPVGTKLFQIKELDTLDYIAVYFENKYILYKTVESEIVSFSSEDDETLKKVTKKERNKLLKQYGYKDLAELDENYTMDNAIDEGATVIVHGDVTSSDQLIDFLGSVPENQPTMVRIVRMTVEGDPIIEDCFFNGSSFLLVRDTTRDKFGEKKIVRKNFNNILGERTDGGKRIILTNKLPNERISEEEKYLFLNEYETEEFDAVGLLRLDADITII